MRSIPVVSIVAAVLSSMFLAGGCVPQQKYDDLWAQNRACNEQLNRALAANQDLRNQFAALQAEIDRLNAQIKAKDEQIAILSGGKEKILEEVERLKKLLEAAKNNVAVLPVPLPAGLNEALKKLAAQYSDILVFDEQRGMVKFKADTTFDPGSDTVKNQAREAMAKLAEILNTPDASPFNVYIAGHTDDIPINHPETLRRHPNNWYLSVDRAVAVEEILQKDKVSPERLGAMGFGEYHPVAPNAPGHKGNVLNRRVEIWIVPPDRFLTVGKGAAAPEPAPE